MTILELAADEYHADLIGDVPTLNASTACTLIEKSPAHARVQHPRLNPSYVAEQKKAWDLGTCVHSLLLEGTDAAYVVEGFDDWRTKDAKAEAAAARERGLIPMLRKEWEQAAAMVDAAREQIEAHQAYPPLLADGRPEVTLAWGEDGVACRARLDWLTDDNAVVDDVKTSSKSARPEDFDRQLYAHGYDLKAAFYLRAVKAITGVDATFRWIVVETTPPYQMSVSTPGPSVLALGNDKVDRALAMWKRCLETDSWPGYDPRVATLEVPGYIEAQWAERSWTE